MNATFVLFPTVRCSRWEGHLRLGLCQARVIPRTSWVVLLDSKYGPSVALPRHGAVLAIRGNFEQRRHLGRHFSHVASRPEQVYVNKAIGLPQGLWSVCGR